MDIEGVERVGFFAQNLRTGKVIAQKRDDEIFRSASTIKVAIACAVMEQVEIGRLSLTQRVNVKDFVGGSGLLRLMFNNVSPTVDTMLQLMLTVSDNTASNVLIDLVGKKAVNELMKRFGFHNIKLHGKFMRPRKKKFNVVTPREIAQLLGLIFKRKVISKSASSYIVKILSFQQHTSLVPSSLPGWWVKCINKPGALSDLRADVAVVWGKDFSYCVSIFAEGFEDASVAESEIRRISREIFDKARSGGDDG